MVYTALVLDDASRERLLNYFQSAIPDAWQAVCHHMTINLGDAGDGPAKKLIGQEFVLVARRVAQDSRVIAVEVESAVPSKNEIKHVTVAVNVNDGGEARHSNELANWKDLDQPIVLRGLVQVVQ